MASDSRGFLNNTPLANARKSGFGAAPVVAATLLALAVPMRPTAAVAPPQAPASGAAGEESPSPPSLPPEEAAAIDRLLGAEAWPRRVIALLRLEGASDGVALSPLQRAVSDPSRHVRAFAIAILARRGRIDLVGGLEDEADPRVVRMALRARVPLDAARIRRGAERLMGSSRNAERLLGVEIALASGDPTLLRDAEETFLSIVLRMSRVEAGILSPRLAAISGADDLRRDFLWRHWVRRHRGDLGLQAAWIVPPRGEGRPPDGNPIARLESRAFLGLVEYLQDLAERRVDLAIALDCTASMSRAIAEAQGGVEDLMTFLGEVAAGLRVGVVAYRDRRDAFETLVHDFTDSIDLARRHLWSLEADGGGDGPEAVHPALRDLYGSLSWMPAAASSAATPRRVAILIGDAPPHPGWGGPSEELARRAAAAGVVTHVVSMSPPRGEDPEGSRRPRGGPPRHFPEIAAAGGGRLVELADRDSLVAEIAGLTLGDRFDEELRALFRMQLELCR